MVDLYYNADFIDVDTEGQRVSMIHPNHSAAEWLSSDTTQAS